MTTSSIWILEQLSYRNGEKQQCVVGETSVTDFLTCDLDTHATSARSFSPFVKTCQHVSVRLQVHANIFVILKAKLLLQMHIVHQHHE